ncbi:unnamed protein product [Clonostachys solani]|uniref:Uncharacterized protein n=1 Tax=Clonostachys solani TaxID=160281 RepID=A0A9P0EKU5_9HYPO|nr:unnamed protein product [Clonostachys solani]
MAGETFEYEYFGYSNMALSRLVQTCYLPSFKSPIQACSWLSKRDTPLFDWPDAAATCDNAALVYVRQ